MSVATEFFSEFWPAGLPDGFFIEFRDLAKSPPPSAFRTQDQLLTLRDADPDAGSPQYIVFSVAATDQRRPVRNETAKLIPAAGVDVDVLHRDAKASTDPADIKDMLQAIVDALGQLAMPPSSVIYSGGGLHLYWRLDRPTDNLALVETVNKHLAAELHGDRAAVNPGRVMRMPGSVNGRLKTNVQAQPWPGYAHWANDDYILDDLLALDGTAVRDTMARVGAASAMTPGERVLQAVDDTAGQLGGRNWEAVEADIRAGNHWHVNVRDRVASLVQRGVAEPDIIAHAVEHWTLPGYSEDDTRSDVLPLIRSAAEKWPVTVGGGDEPAEQALTYETWRSLWPFDQRANKFVDLAGDGAMLTHQAWELRNAPFVETTVDDDGKTKRVKWVDRYKLDLQKTVLDGADVLPYQPRICGNGAVRKLNLWHENPAVEWSAYGDPESDAANLYRELIHWLCDGRADYAEQVFRWAACSLYRMDERMRYALLCISHEKGTGKSLAFEILRRLHHEPHTASLESLSQLTGRFTGWMQAKTLVVVQETTDGAQGRWGSMEALKSAISEEFIQVEQKFNDPQMTRHFTRFVFLGNALDSLPFDSNERRIFAVVCHNQPKDPDWYLRVAMQCLSEQGLADIAAMLRGYALEPLPLRAPESDTDQIQDSLIPPFVDIINEAADTERALALRGKDMNDIVRHVTGQSLRGGGQTEQLKRGGWRAVRTTIDGVNGRFWVRGQNPEQIDTTLRDRIVNGGSEWVL